MGFKNIFGRSQRANIENIQSDFVSLSSHQLRTPLSAIKWYSELLMEQKAGKLTDKQLLYLREISRSNDRAINLVNDLLDVSRIQEGQIHLEFRPTKVESVVEEVLDNLNDLIKASQTHINFEIKSGPLPQIETDREKLKRIVSNILSNAIRYTPRQGQVRVILEQPDDHLMLTVADSGVGIPAHDQHKVFSKFFRSSNVIKLAPDGTGLGLFITKSLVDAMGGKLSFESTEGKGAIFYLTLPVKNN